MKALVAVITILVGVCFSAHETKAQSIAKVTKVTAASATTGSVVLEDTTAGRKEYFPFRRGELLVKVTGSTSADARFTVWTRSGKVVFTGLINPMRVVFSGNNGASPTLTQKIAWLQANTF